AGNVPQNTGRWLTLQKGESVTIPCFYHPWYKNYVKQWCSGLEIFSCTVMASTDSPQVHRVSIIDDPTQGVFTVTMNNVQESDSGTYWCLGKYGGWNELDDPYYITVTDTPDMSVKDNMVEAQLGDSVTVHCFYSHSYRDREKKWCRSEKNSFCVRSWTRGKSRQRVTLKVDSALGVFSVTVRDLEQKDRGWYWCSVGDRLFPVHISVTQKRQSK
ncbi:hypothetical protein Z043_124812, partial [Scleropages formosus]